VPVQLQRRITSAAAVGCNRVLASLLAVRSALACSRIALVRADPCLSFTRYRHAFAPSTMLVPKLSCSGMTLVTRNPVSL
jgi:hypothetical protein